MGRSDREQSSAVGVYNIDQRGRARGAREDLGECLVRIWVPKSDELSRWLLATRRMPQHAGVHIVSSVNLSFVHLKRGFHEGYGDFAGLYTSSSQPFIGFRAQHLAQ